METQFLEQKSKHCDAPQLDGLHAYRNTLGKLYADDFALKWTLPYHYTRYRLIGVLPVYQWLTIVAASKDPF